MSSPATCMGVAARCGTLVLGVEPVEGQWRITITDRCKRNVICIGARNTFRYPLPSGTRP